MPIKIEEELDHEDNWFPVERTRMLDKCATLDEAWHKARELSKKAPGLRIERNYTLSQARFPWKIVGIFPLTTDDIEWDKSKTPITRTKNARTVYVEFSSD